MRAFVGKIKVVLIYIWKFGLELRIYVSTKFVGNRVYSEPRINFAGAISGNRGGPRVKVQYLRSHFSESHLRFNLIYVLSNYPYLTDRAIALAKGAAIPIVTNQNGVYHSGWAGNSFDSLNSANRKIYKRSDYVFWQSSFAREAAREFLSKIDPPGEVLFNSVDLDTFKPLVGKKNQKLFKFLMSGNFKETSLYQVKAGMQAFANMVREKNVHLVVAGLSRKSHKPIQSFAKELGIQEFVTLLGTYDHSQAPYLLQQMDAYLALKYMDTCPNLAIEAMASGLPIIYSATGGMPEIIGKEAGQGIALEEDWHVAPRAPDVNLISAAMIGVMEDAVVMGNAARARAEKSFDIRNWYQRHLEIFEMVATKGGTQ